MERKNTKITVLVNSCDIYEDAWNPFFKLFQIQWPSCDYDIVLNTEEKQYDCDFMEIRTICSGRKAWSKRLLYCLDRISSDYILFFLEDQFLQQSVNTLYWNKTVSYMDNNSDVGVIFPRHSDKQKKDYKLDFFPRELITDKYRIVGMVALYRKDYLTKLLRKHENPWEFEKYASIRSKRLKEKVLQYSKFNPAIFVYDDLIQNGYGITARKWLPKNKELFKKYGIEVNYDNLGFYDLEKYNMQQNETINIETPKEIKENFYVLKKRILGFPKKANLIVRKLKSII